MQRDDLTYHVTDDIIFCQDCHCSHLDCECDNPNLWNQTRRETFDWKNTLCIVPFSSGDTRKV